MKIGPFLGRFGRKRAICAQQNDILFYIFPVFRDFLSRKPLPVRIFHRCRPLQKNHTKKPTVGFWCFGPSGKISCMNIEICADDIVGEEVARQANRNRECTRMDAKHWERDRLGRCGMRLAPRSGKKDTDREVLEGTPNTAVDPSPLRFDATRTTALPIDWISEHSRLWASIRGWRSCFLIFLDQLTQVVDFHDRFG
jgi:hypothetical protein